MGGEFWRKLRYLFGFRDSVQLDVAQEIRFHIECRAEELEQEGMPRSQALLQARREFGPGLRLAEQSGEAWQFRGLESFLSAVRYALRSFRRNPLFAGMAVLTLALGIGANTAIFTLLDQLVLRLLPVREPERLVMIWTTGPHLGNNAGDRNASYPMYQDFQKEAKAFESIFCRYTTPLAMSFQGSTERVNAELVSGNYFDALGVPPMLGRLFSPQSDDRVYKGHPVVVLSEVYWRNRFASDPAIVGKKILLNSYPMEVVGVAPHGFAGVDPTQSPHLWVPIQMKPLMTPGQDWLGDRRTQWVQMFARLKPGYTPESARASLQPLFHQVLEAELASTELSKISAADRQMFLRRSAIVEQAAGGYSDMRQQYSTALTMLMCMAGLILLIACSNVANLLIARAMARQKEIAVRLSIGASRKMLVAQLLIESAIISLCAAALGLGLAVAATRGLLHMLPNDGTLLMLSAEPNLRLLGFSTAVALATSLIFGLVPALQGTKLDLWSALKDAGGAVAGSGSSTRLRKSLVVLQVALSFLLLAGAGLFVRTLSNLKNTETGFANLQHLVTFRMDAARAGYSPAKIRMFYGDAVREIEALPGVRSAAYALVPLLHGDQWDSSFSVEGRRGVSEEDMRATYNAISFRFWPTVGVKMLEGRDFDQRDMANHRETDVVPTVAIVNRKFAEHFFGKGRAVGRRIGFGGRPGDAPNAVPLTTEIVGVVENALYAGPRQAVRPEVFLLCPQANVPLPATFYVQTSGDPAAIASALRGAVAKLDATMPVFELKTLQTQVDETLSTERLIALLSAVFGGLATALAAMGMYGVMAFLVARRTKELGLRIALGATQRAALWLVLREALALFSAGLLLGAPIALLVSGYLASELYGVSPTDALTFCGAVALLGLVATASGFVPARRASTIDPQTALRYE